MQIADPPPPQREGEHMIHGLRPQALTHGVCSAVSAGILLAGGDLDEPTIDCQCYHDICALLVCKKFFRAEQQL